MRPSWLAPALAILVVSTAAAQDTAYGDGFYAMCNEGPNTEPDSWRRPLCIAYIKGLNDMAGYLKPSSKAGLACVPPSATLDQFLDILVQYLRDNPARRQELTAELMWEAAAKSYPCPGR
jgi:hypothetical protein